MTKLQVGKPVMRETLVQERGDVVVAELHPRHLILRLKRQRTPVFEFPYERLVRMGYAQEAERMRRERVAGKVQRPMPEVW